MSNPARASSPVRAAVAGVVIAVCVALIIRQISFVVPLRLAGQAYLILVMLLAFRYWPPMVRWMTVMPVIHRVVFGVLVGALILGHLTLRSPAFYPYIAWEIFPFVSEENPVNCRELIATTASGKKVRLLVEQLFPSIVQFNLPNDADYERPGATERLAASLARIYNEQHASDPVRGVDLVLMAVNLHPSTGESSHQPSCELLQHYDVSSDR
jgi:hypothetical protein